jgi:hypothetical protein
MIRRVFVDTEWTAVPWSGESTLLWIGLADEAGRTWCGLSSEARVDPSNQKYVSDLLQLVTPDVPRLARADLGAAVLDFCGDVDEFWAWIPTLKSFAEWSRLGDDASRVYQACRDIDLRMLQGLVTPWPKTWPTRLQDLNATAVAAGVQVPPRAVNHLHPRVHVQWNRQLFDLIRAVPVNSALGIA